MIKAFPKIFTLGQKYIIDIFDGPVEVTEKLDGSQFSWGKIDGELYFRSKGKEQIIEAPDKMFQPPIEYLLSVQDRIEEGSVFYGEILNRPKHNTLKYETIPRNGIALFGFCDKTHTDFNSSYSQLALQAEKLGIDIVRILHSGVVPNMGFLEELLQSRSALGGEIEGVVVKNYSKNLLIGGQVIPIMCGKLVSERFKEVHKKSWGKENTGRGKWQTFVESFRTEARWEKAIQHLREAGELEDSPRDIGKLIKEIHKDITEEEKEDIMEFMWRTFSGEIMRKSTTGFAEFYKKKLAEKSFE